MGRIFLPGAAGHPGQVESPAGLAGTAEGNGDRPARVAHSPSLIIRRMPAARAPDPARAEVMTTPRESILSRPITVAAMSADILARTLERCGVKVTHSRVRRKRMGHINLAAPIVHIWFFKAMPSRLGTLLGMKTNDLEKVIYYQDYVVVDHGDTELKFKQVLTEDEHRQAVDKYGNAFRALMGADAKHLAVATHSHSPHRRVGVGCPFKKECSR